MTNSRLLSPRSLLVLLILVLLCLAAQSQAQIATFTLSNLGLKDQLFNDADLNCTKDSREEFLPDGWDVVIYWDANHNGIDAADKPVIVGDEPGQANYNRFDLNGVAYGDKAGQFYSDPAFIFVLPSKTAESFYLQIFSSPDGTGYVIWQSALFSSSGGVTEVYFGSEEGQTEVKCGPSAASKPGK